MKRIVALTILMVSIAAFAMEGRSISLLLITGCVSVILVSIVNIGNLFRTRASVPASLLRAKRKR
jgi:F0F1-type ATP synthase assembly protein I